MKIFWFPRLQSDTDKYHITTWREMTKELKLRGHDVRIAVAGPSVENYFNCRYIRIPIIRKKFIRIITFFTNSLFIFIRECLADSPDVIILDIFTAWLAVPARIILRGKSRPTIIVDSRNPHYNTMPFKRPELYDLFNFNYSRFGLFISSIYSDGVTVITPFYKQHLIRDFNFVKKPIEVWSSGVDADIFSPSEFSHTTRPDYLTDKFVIMQHGEVSPNRGILESIKAISLISNRNICLAMMGGFIRNDGMEPKIRQLIRKLNLEDRVYLIPKVDYKEVPKYLSYCDCAIMAYPNIEYWNYNNPIKLYEYLAMGKVVIVTDMITFRDVMGDNKCAVYIPDNRPEYIADAISRCYASRDSLVERGKAGRVIVENGKTWQAQAKKLNDFIDSVRSK